MKTIKQIADELGVSKQAVFKKIDNLGLRSRLKKNANQFTVDEETETLILQGFSNVERQRINVNKIKTSEQEVDDIIAILKEQLAVKDRQIEQLTAALENTTASLRAAQALHAGTIQQQLEAGDQQKEVVEPEQPRRWWRFWKTK